MKLGRREVIQSALAMSVTNVAQSAAQGTPSQQTVATQYVGILTSTLYSGTIGADFKSSFESGFATTFGAAPTYATASPVEANGAYDARGKVRKALYNGVTKLITTKPNQASLIIALGGLVSAHAAVQNSTIPFLVLTGRVPEESDFTLLENTYYCGGVDLHTVGNNFDRRDSLISRFGVASSSVYLLYNPNSRMAQSEVNEWRAQGGEAEAAAVPNNNDPAEFATAFARLTAKGAQGVVISADPFFSSHRTELVTAANTAAAAGVMKICYPFEIFGNMGNPRPTATTVPLAGSGISIGPSLITAYTLIGQKAGRMATILAANSAATPKDLWQGLDTVPLLGLIAY
jgi:hypothetical protein